MTEVLYSDSLICITKNSIRFQQYYFPCGSKSIEISQIDHVEVLKPTLLGGKWRIHGTGDFRTWFPRDAKRPNRDLLLYLLWQLGQLTNQQIGEKFGLRYSAVSQRGSIFKGLLKKNQALRNKLNQLKSQIKI